LQPLPLNRYEYADFKEAKIPFDYHVEYEKGFFYSVDHSYVGAICTIRATIGTVEIFVNNERICAHVRNYNKYKRYTTLPDHMPEAHKAVSGWNDERFISWANKIGLCTATFIKHVLDSREHSVQSYRACMGIMRLAKKYPSEIMEAACKKANESNVFSYKYFEMIIKNEAQTKNIPAEMGLPPRQNNLRGSEFFKGGGIIV
jgi:hypothetical protein